MVGKDYKTIYKTVMNNKTGIALVFALLFVDMAAIAFAGTGAADSGITDAGTRISCALCRIASLIFMVVGALAALVIIMAGLRWVTSGEDPGQETQLKPQ